MQAIIRYCITILCFTISVVCYSQKVCFSYHGDWSSWQRFPGKVRAYQDGSGLVLVSDSGKEYFKFHIRNFSRPSKQELKNHEKNQQWFSYYGSVEYYVNDTYPTADALAKASCFVIPNARQDQTPSVLRCTTGEIRIYPYKNNPKTYNIFFDNIGIGLSVKGLEFEGQKSSKNKGRVAANIVQSVLLFPIGLCSWWWNPVYDNKGE